MTREQARVLEAVRALTVGGVAPSFAEIAVACGLSPKSKDLVRRRLIQLREAGLVAFEPYRARTVRVLADGPAYTPAALCRLEPDALRRLIAAAAGVLAHKDAGARTALARIGERLARVGA